jgi:two-component system phosphate regulon response regulator OmpR
MGRKVQIIDDDEKLNSLLEEYLGEFGYEVSAFSTPEAGLRALAREVPDILILDVMLPGMDGFAVCKKVRETSRLPIIMLTARGEVADRIVGLELGADDYLPKPFEPRELVARMQAVLRRGVAPEGEGRLRAGGLEVDWDRQSATLDGEPLTLTSAEFELLGVLVRNLGRVLSRDRIMNHMRGLDWEAFDRSIDVLVSRLRQKLGDDPKSPSFIKTVWGRGYKFIGGSRGESAAPEG